jgi:hypothetical protein
MSNRRDFKEEVMLNSAEWYLLKEIAGQMGSPKSAVLRYALLQLGNKFTRERIAAETCRNHED